MSYEDQLYVWCLLLRNNLAGKIAPAHPWDRRPTEYALLVPDKLAVDEINAMRDTPVTVAHLRSILARFRHLDPPFDKGNATPARAGAAPASAYGYELVNGVPRWNNGGLRLREHLARTETGDAPWLSQGISRATWYRRQHQDATAQRETRETPNSI